MSTPKFTPGPWRTDATWTHHCNTGVRILRDVTYVEGRNARADVITDIIYPAWCPNGTVGETERIANAHLIAAAPELYKALSCLIDVCDGNYRELTLEMEQVLAKARGEE